MADSDEFSVEVNKALDFLAERGFSRCLREEQKSSLQQLWRGGDLMAVLPTGFGKSLIFQLLVLTRKEACVLVICPLKSIIQDQILEATSMGISAGSLSDCNLLDIENGKFQLLFASAEEVLQNKGFLSSLKNEKTVFHQNLAAVVVDESHTIETWTGKR